MLTAFQKGIGMKGIPLPRVPSSLGPWRLAAIVGALPSACPWSVVFPHQAPQHGFADIARLGGNKGVAMETTTLELVKMEIATLAIVGLATGLIGMVLLASIVGGLRTILPILAGTCVLGALITGGPQGAAIGLLISGIVGISIFMMTTNS